MTNENQPTKEKMREYWLGRLNNKTLVSMALPSLAEQLGYTGEALNDIDAGKYVPAITSEDGEKVIREEVIPYLDVKDVGKNLINSRREGKYGTGKYSINLDEKEISDSLAGRVAMGFNNITVEDAFRILGTDKKVPGEYAGKYLGELLQAKDEKGAALYGGALNYFVKSQIAEATSESAKQIKEATLEKILKKEEPKEKPKEKEK